MSTLSVRLPDSIRLGLPGGNRVGIFYTRLLPEACEARPRCAPVTKMHDYMHVVGVA